MIPATRIQMPVRQSIGKTPYMEDALYFYVREGVHTVAYSKRWYCP